MRDYYGKVIVARFVTVLILMLGAAIGSSFAQEGSKLQIRSSAESPVAFDLASQSGKTVLIFHWRTNCSVCLDKMEELRTNIAGWRSKPFVVLAVNHDRSRQDFLSYIKISRTIHGDNPQLIHIFSKDLERDSLYRGSVLPTSYVIDEKQTLRHTYTGRIPADAWNDIADLLP